MSDYVCYCAIKVINFCWNSFDTDLSFIPHTNNPKDIMMMKRSKAASPRKAKDNPLKPSE